MRRELSFGPDLSIVEYLDRLHAVRKRDRLDEGVNRRVPIRFLEPEQTFAQRPTLPVQQTEGIIGIARGAGTAPKRVVQDSSRNDKGRE